MNQVILFFLAFLTPVPGKVSPELNRILARTSPEEKIIVIVHMNTEYPHEWPANLDAAGRGTAMREIATSSQRGIVDFISNLSSINAVMGGRYWIFNGFHLKATRDVIEALARRDDVWYVSENRIIKLAREEPMASGAATAEWNILKVMADSCWQAGYSGEGVILGFVDTGVMTTHEALAGKWLSPYWLDAINGQAAPYDDQGHGTAVAGVACGGDGPGPMVNDIGIAYGAKIIPTKAFSSGGSGTYQTIDSCLQYLAGLRISGVAIRAINNSWGSGTNTDLHWWDIMLNLKTIGVLPVCAVGGSGPGAGTVAVPASYPTVIGSGATDASDNIAGFSSRGPAPDQNPWNDSTYWYYSTWDLLKPDVSAPGVNIRTSFNDGGYVVYSGASFATPHVTGGSALFCDKDSMLSVPELYYLFRAYCDAPPQGAPYPNMNYGWGRINLWRGLQALEGVEEERNKYPPDNRLYLKIYPTITHDRLNITCRIGHSAKSMGLKIYDIFGCAVKSFTLCPAPAALCVKWDGRDDNGRMLASGVYLIEFTADDRSVTGKALILR